MPDRRILAWLGVLVLCGAAAVWAAELTAALRFSHKTHYDQDVKCERCHVAEAPESAAGLPPGWSPLRPSRVAFPTPTRVEVASGEAEPGKGAFGRPPEKTCLGCHPRGKRRSECGFCHLDRPAATVRDRKRLPERTKFPHEKHGKTDCLDCHPHVTDWETLDGNHVDLTMTGCLVCHNGVKAQKTCTLCHAKTPRPKDHVRNYENKHGLSYRADPMSCRACHEDSTCLACHARKPRSHTLAWISRRHGMAAQSNPDSCSACHSDRFVCRRCHER